MTLTLRLSFLLSLASVLSFAASWTGALVNSECYASLQSNTSNVPPGSHDTRRAIRYCSPNEKTKSFSVVVHGGVTFNLDSDGNEKARELVLKKGKKSPYMVNVKGEMTQNTFKVNTISIAK